MSKLGKSRNEHQRKLLFFAKKRAHCGHFRVSFFHKNISCAIWGFSAFFLEILKMRDTKIPRMRFALVSTGFVGVFPEKL